MTSSHTPGPGSDISKHDAAPPVASRLDSPLRSEDPRQSSTEQRIHDRNSSVAEVDPPVPAVVAHPSSAARRRRHRLVVAAGAAGAVLLAGGTATYAYAGDVPRGTTVLGLDLGGKSRTEAARALRNHLDQKSDQLSAPVQVRIGEQTVQVRPADIDLVVDVDATVAASTHRARNPFSLLFGSRSVDPVVSVDTAKLDTRLRPAAAQVSRPITVPKITFTGTTPRPTYPGPGTGLDPRRSADAVREGWLSGRAVSVAPVEITPATSAEEVDRLMAGLAKPAVAAPITVTTDHGSLTVSPAAIAKSLVLIGDKTGKITPRLDETRLRAALANELAKVEVTPKEATVAISGGKPKVLASTGGQRVDIAALGRNLFAVLPSPAPREVTASLSTVQPQTTTEELGKLGITEQVSTFTTKFTGGLGAPRSRNIVRIAKEVDGAIVKPGETFSLNGHTGERGYKQGYNDAPVILNGKLVPGVAGGTSQFTTTLFNASYYAGLEDVQHKPHSYWFSRYPPVIESTIFYPDLDLKFRNNTRYGVLIDTSYTSSSITVSMWSTRVYDSVTTTWSARRNITSPRVIYLTPGPTCTETNGIDGFTQDAWRIFRKDGKELKREKFSWTYDAEPRYRCAKQP